MSDMQSPEHTLTSKQRLFVAVLLLLGFVLSFLVIRFLDLSAVTSCIVPPWISWAVTPAGVMMA